MKKAIIVFDFETGNLENGPKSCPIQIAGLALDYYSLEPVPVASGGEFQSMMKPVHFDDIQDGALNVNKKTRAEIAAAPGEEQVWQSFVQWVQGFARSKNKWDAPVPCGHNIINFDLPIAASLNARHKIKGQLFHPRDSFDTQQMCNIFFWGHKDPPEKISLDCIRDYLVMNKEGAHDAMKDVRDCAVLIQKFLKLSNAFNQKVRFRGACAA